jgi:hypothetical protein
VPVEVRTCPFEDDGVETVAYVRRFDLGPGRRFDAYMRYDEGRDCVVDALGTTRTLRTELGFAVTPTEAPSIEAGDQWVAVGDRTVAVPDPLRADVTVTERYDDERDRSRSASRCRTPSSAACSPTTGGSPSSTRTARASNPRTRPRAGARTDR